MKVMIWRRLDNVSRNYHSEGGAVVIAESHEDAMKLLRANNEVPASSDIFIKQPDLAYDIVGGTEGVEIFPDAGCC